MYVDRPVTLERIVYEPYRETVVLEVPVIKEVRVEVPVVKEVIREGTPPRESLLKPSGLIFARRASDTCPRSRPSRSLQ